MVFKVLKKILMLGENNELICIPATRAESDEINVTNKDNYRLEGRGAGYQNCIILTGNNNSVVVENSVVTLRGFTGNLTAKNSQVYIDQAQGDITLETSSCDIIGTFTGTVKAIYSYINIDEFFGSLNGSVESSLGGAYIGPIASLNNDGTVVTKDTTPEESTDEVFAKAKVLVADYRKLSSLPKVEFDDKVVVKVSNRYMMFTLQVGKTTRVKSAVEVFVNYNDGVTINDSNGNIIYRKH